MFEDFELYCYLLFASPSDQSSPINNSLRNFFNQLGFQETFTFPFFSMHHQDAYIGSEISTWPANEWMSHANSMTRNLRNKVIRTLGKVKFIKV